VNKIVARIFFRRPLKDLELQLNSRALHLRCFSKFGKIVTPPELHDGKAREDRQRRPRLCPARASAKSTQKKLQGHWARSRRNESKLARRQVQANMGTPRCWVQAEDDFRDSQHRSEVKERPRMHWQGNIRLDSILEKVEGARHASSFPSK
jgi:hypothetical protein